MKPCTALMGYDPTRPVGEAAPLPIVRSRPQRTRERPCEVCGTMFVASIYQTRVSCSFDCWHALKSRPAPVQSGDEWGPYTILEMVEHRTGGDTRLYRVRCQCGRTPLRTMRSLRSARKRRARWCEECRPCGSGA